MCTVGDLLYRYEDVLYAPSLDEFDNPQGSSQVVVELRTYKVVRVTPCGVRLDTGRFVNQQRHKQFAHVTKEAALESFISRKKWQARHLNRKLENVEYAIEMAQGIRFAAQKA